jgi:hypothetical protein
LDFFIPEIKLAIEISPNFHHSYETVAIRDKLRASLLKRKNNITTIEVKVCFRTKKGVIETYLDKKSVDYAIKEIKTAKKSQESLNYYL